MSNLENEIHTLRNLQRLFHEAFPEHLYDSTAVYLRGATSSVLAALGPRIAVMTRTRATESILSSIDTSAETIAVDGSTNIHIVRRLEDLTTVAYLGNAARVREEAALVVWADTELSVVDTFCGIELKIKNALQGQWLCDLPGPTELWDTLGYLGAEYQQPRYRVKSVLSNLYWPSALSLEDIWSQSTLADARLPKHLVPSLWELTQPPIRDIITIRTLTTTFHHEHEGDDLDLAGHIPFGRPPEGKQPTRHKEMNEKKRYRCTLCHTHRTFTRRGDARRHIRKSCKRSIHKVDQCPRCGDTLSRNDSVQRHAPICTGIPSKKRGHDKRDSGVGDDSFDARGRSDDELDRFIDLIG
ncbi:predicted protein [Postia placenta Mad-698-R]|nr:predicted protein [Postia placenta Mad-698-R]